MEHQYKVCCGLDVHKKLLVACLRTGCKTEIRECGASTREILELADWLLENQCECAAMESTGSCWKPVYNIVCVKLKPSNNQGPSLRKSFRGRGHFCFWVTFKKLLLKGATALCLIILSVPDIPSMHHCRSQNCERSLNHEPEF